MNSIEYFKKDYKENRNEFIRSFNRRAKGSESSLHSIKIDSKDCDDLFIDIGYIPSKSDKKRLIIISSGLHGIEGFVGSPLQCYFLNNIHVQKDDTGILLIHSINPYGFKYFRRSTENNVDLNRNFDTEDTLFKIKNELYFKINKLINPDKKLDYSLHSQCMFYMNLIIAILRYGTKPLRQAIPQGQYECEKGIFYGGKRFEQNVTEVNKYLKTILPKYEEILAVDIHTGVGQRYKMHLIEIPNMSNQLDRGKMNVVFNECKLEGNDSSFHKETGSFLECIFKMLRKDQTYLPILIDFGTLNSESIFGAIKSLKISINENQKNRFGCRNLKAEKKQLKDYIQMFYPDEIKWRENTIKQFDEVVTRIIHKYEGLI